MNDVAFQQRELTLMFTDIVGYSRLMGRDQAQTIAMLEDYRRILLEQIDKQQGTIIEFIGDAVFARFDTPQAAITAAVSIQKELFTFNHFRDKSLPRLQTRIGLHCGQVTTKGNAVFGDDVNIAARLEPIAVADGICISQAVYDAVKDELKEPVLSLGVQPLKNIESKVRAYLVRPLGITFKTRAHYWNRKLNQKLGAYRYPIAAAIVLVIISLIYWVPRWLVPGYDANYVEIADFQNLMNAGGEVDYLSAGITEAVRSQLADVRDVYLVKSGEGILAPIKLEGSVQKVGENLRIAYQLIRRKGNVQIAGGKLDGAYEDIFILQDRVVAEIAKYLAEEFGLPNFRPAKIDITSDVLAYDYYMRGLEWLNKPSSEANMDEAIKFFTTALVHDKNFVLANAALCKAYWKKHYLTEVSEYVLKAENYCNLAIKLGRNSLEAVESMSLIYKETGRPQQAINLINSFLEKGKGNVQLAVTLANIYGSANNLDRAEAVLMEAVVKEPKNWHGYQGLGLLYLRKNKINKAIIAYEQVLKITPKNSTTLSNLGVCYLYKGDFEKAASYFERSISIHPGYFGYSNLGTMNYFMGKYSRSIDFYKKAIQLAPGDYILYVNIGDAYRQISETTVLAEENYELAIELARDALEINSEDAMAHLYLAQAYYYVGNEAESSYHLERAFSISPSDPNVQYLKMKFYLYSGNDLEAGKLFGLLTKDGYFSAFLDADPDLSNYRDKLRVLESRL